MCELLSLKQLHWCIEELSFQLSNKRIPADGEVHVYPRSRSLCCVRAVYTIQRGTASTGAAQVMQPGKSVRARLPVSGAIIVPRDSMIISPQCAMVGSVHHPHLGGGWGPMRGVGWRCLKRWHHKSGRQLSFSLNFCLCVYKRVKDYVTEGPPNKSRQPFVPEPF